MLALVEFAGLDQGALIGARDMDHLDDCVRTLILRAGAAGVVHILPAGLVVPVPFNTLLPLDILRAEVATARAELKG